jgi:hypothetical protein
MCRCSTSSCTELFISRRSLLAEVLYKWSPLYFASDSSMWGGSPHEFLLEVLYLFCVVFPVLFVRVSLDVSHVLCVSDVSYFLSAQLRILS